MIRADKVNKWYGDFHVLNDFSLEVQEGEVVVVCGPSGSGKSTFLRAVNGLERIQSGSIHVYETRVNDPRTDLNSLRTKIGIVFQKKIRTEGHLFRAPFVIFPDSPLRFHNQMQNNC